MIDLQNVEKTETKIENGGVDNGRDVKMQEVVVRGIESKRDYLKEIESPDFKVDVNFATELSFERLYKETYQFDIDNNHLQFPKILAFLSNHNKKKLCSVQTCKHETGFKNLYLCSNHRRQLANELGTLALEKNIMTKELNGMIINLMMSDNVLYERSKEKQRKSDYFAIVFAFLKWQQEIITELLANVSFSNSNNDNNDDIDIGNENKDEENEKSLLFDFLFEIHSYLGNVCELLILCYCCFDWPLIINVFGPCFEKAIGENGRHINFYQSMNRNSVPLATDVDAPGIVGFKAATDGITVEEIKKYRQDIESGMVGVIYVKQLIYDYYSIDNTTEKKNDDNDTSYDALKYVLTIESKLNEMISNVKSQITIFDIQSNDKQAKMLQLTQILNTKVNAAKMGLPYLNKDEVSKLTQRCKQD